MVFWPGTVSLCAGPPRITCVVCVHVFFPLPFSPHISDILFERVWVRTEWSGGDDKAPGTWDSFIACIFTTQFVQIHSFKLGSYVWHFVCVTLSVNRA